jgi:hypothetical protein
MLTRNQYANGSLALPMGIHLFATKAHTDTKRILSRLGLSVSDSTVRHALRSMTEAERRELEQSIALSEAQGEVNHCLVIDNVQRYNLVREPGLGMQSKMITGTAATAVKLEDCPTGAFNLQDQLSRILAAEKKQLTTQQLYEDLQFSSLDSVMAVHWLRILVEYIPELSSHLKDVMAAFEDPSIKSYRIPSNRKTKVQPLGTSGEKEVEHEGMARALRDFDSQLGKTKERGHAETLISWHRGDGASHAASCQLQEYNQPVLDNYDAHRHRLSTPEVWHARLTTLNAIATNHYGPSASLDPSSLSKSSSVLGVKIPGNTQNCDFYTTSRNMTIMYKARVIDIWR